MAAIVLLCFTYNGSRLIKRWYTCYSFHTENFIFFYPDTATRLGSVSDTDDGRSTSTTSPKPATKSVSWASSVTSSVTSSDSASDAQEIVALRQELKESMRENLE